MRDLLIYAVVFGSIPLILARPWIGVLLWAWVSYMNPHRFAYGLYDFPIAAWIGGATLLALIFTRESRRIPWTPTTTVLVLFVAWTCVTTPFAIFADDGVAGWSRFMKIQVVTFVTLMLFLSEQRLRWLVIVIAGSLAFYGVKGGLFTIATGGQYRVWGPPDSFIGDNNSMALALVMTLPLLNYVRATLEHKWLKLAVAAAMGLTLFAIIGSQSRGAFLAGGAMLLLLFLKSNRKAISAVLLLLCVVILAFFVPETWVERMRTISEYQEDASAMGRINAWWFAFNLALDRPLVGGGFGAFDPRLFPQYAPIPDDYHDAHSIYFEVLGEQGFVGLFLFLLLGMLALRTGTWVARHTKDIPELARLALLAQMTRLSLIGYAMGGLFLGLAYFDLYYHLIVVLVAVRIIVERRLNEIEQSKTGTGEGGLSPSAASATWVGPAAPRPASSYRASDS